MKPMDYNLLDQIAKSNLSEALTHQTLQNIRHVQIPAQQGFLPQPVVLPVMENILQRQEATQTAIPPQIPQAAQYYLAIEDNAKGPFTSAQVRDFLQQGIISDRTLCWKEGLSGWTPIRDTEELTR